MQKGPKQHFAVNSWAPQAGPLVRFFGLFFI